MRLYVIARPDGGCRDEADEQQTDQVHYVRGLQEEDVLQEKRVQLHHLPGQDQDPHCQDTHRGGVGVQPSHVQPAGGGGGRAKREIMVCWISSKRLGLGNGNGLVTLSANLVDRSQE